MSRIIEDRILETSTTTGTGAYTLAGAVTGFRPASAVCANGDTIEYYAEDVDSAGRPIGGWETGLGTWGTGNTLTRTVIYSSSNSGSVVSWTTGTRRIALSLTALGLTTSVASSLRANHNISGGGTITVDASYNVLWSTRFIVISNSRGLNTASSGYYDITCPTSGTITGVGGAANATATAAGVPLAGWEALYYILPLGSNNTTVASNFRLVGYTSDFNVPYDWVLICHRNADGGNGRVYFPKGVSLAPGTSATPSSLAINTATASAWQTARTLSLTGGVTGSVSIDGSANVSLAATVANDSHTHDTRYYTETEIQTADISVRRFLVNANGVPSSNLGAPTIAEMALFDAQFNNKTELYDITNVFVETSTDGTTWSTFSVTDTQKRTLLTGDGNSSIVIPYNTAYFRVRFRATSYVYLNALYSYFSSQGHQTQVQTYKKHDSGTYTQHTGSTTLVSGWPGHIYLPFPTIPFHNAGTLGTHYHETSIVFIPTWNPTYSTNGIALYKMQLWGGYPAGKRNLYSTDELGNATFPAGLTANTSSTNYIYAYNSTAATSGAPQSSPRVGFYGAEWNSGTGSVAMTAYLQLQAISSNVASPTSKLSVYVGANGGAATETAYFGNNGNFVNYGDVSLTNSTAATTGSAPNGYKQYFYRNSWNSTTGSNLQTSYIYAKNITNNANPTVEAIVIAPSDGATSSAGNEAFFFTGTGNFGIGVTPNSWYTGFSALQIKSGGAALWSDGLQRLFLSSNVYYNGTNRIYQTAGVASEYVQDSGSHIWYSAISGTAGGNISLSQLMTLRPDGKLGLGIISPQARIHADGNIAAAGGTQINFVTSGNAGTWIGGIQDATSGWGLSNASIGFKSDDTTYAAIGIGTTNGLLYFGRTTASGAGTLASWLEVNSSGVANFKLSRPQHNGSNLALVSEIPTVNNATLTLNVSGTGLSGSQTFTANQATAATFTVSSNATNANTASTIVARDGSGNFSAGTITAALAGNASTATTLETTRTINGVNFNGSANITIDQLRTLDDRTIAPADITTGYMKFGFTSFNNNNTSPYADYLHLRSYTDSSGGLDNLVMFRKDAIGIRIWQQTYGSATAYATYKDVAFTDQIPTVNNATLTMNVSGVGLSGSQTFTANQATAATFTVTSNATNLNTGSTIVSRDASGNFAAGTITATLSGNASSSTTVTGTQLGNATHGLTVLSTEALWSQPAGYQTMVNATGSNGLPTSHGQNYFGYTVTSRRDTGGGYSALLTAYDNSQLWFTYTNNSTVYPTWRKVWHDGNLTPITSLAATAPIAVSAATGAVTISHNNSGVTAGTYNNVTVNATGHVTAGSNAGYLTSESDTLATVTARGNTTTTTITHGGLTPSAGTNIDQIYSVTDSLTLSTSWQDTSVNAAELASGSYVVQVYVNDNAVGGGHYATYYTGMMSWTALNTNATDSDEIVLHRAGHASNAGAIFLRVLRTSDTDVNDLKLQISGTTANTGASNYVFKFRRLI